MGSYKPFFVRQRAAMQKGSVAKQVVDPATLLPSVEPTAVAPEYNNPGYQTASLSTADGAQEIEQGQQEGDVGANTTDFANSIESTTRKFGRNTEIQNMINSSDNVARTARLQAKLNRREKRQAKRAERINKRNK
jgi:hypothetical protein